MNRRGFLGLAGTALLAPFVPIPPADIVAATVKTPRLSSLTTFDALMKALYTEEAVEKLAYGEGFVWSRVA